MAKTFILVVVTIIPYLQYMILFYLACKNRTRQNRHIPALMIILCMLAQLGAGAWALQAPGAASGAAYYVFCYLGVPFMMASALYTCTIFESLFLVFTGKCYLDSLFTLSKILQVYVVEDILGVSDECNFVIAYTIILIAGFPAMCLFMRYMVRRLMDATKGFKFWVYVWGIPLSSYLVYQIGISPDYQKPYQVWDRTRIFLPLLWIVGTSMTIVLIVRMLTEVSKAAKEHEQMEMMKLQIQMMEEQYEKIQTNIEWTKRARHDLRHEILALKESFEKSDREKFKRYMDQLLEYNMNAMQEISVCHNYAVDSIAGYYLRIARENGIEVKTQIVLPEKLKVREIDLGIIFGNLLENALEACLRQRQEKPFIRVKSGYRGNQIIFISVENSCNNEIQYEGDGFLSSKTNSAGIGTMSVKSIALKYNGVAEFKCADNVFSAKVMLSAAEQESNRTGGQGEDDL